MRVIARKRLRDFWESLKIDAESEIARRDLSAWFKLAEDADWANFGALKRTFGSADAVGNCVVFDVGNNRFRLISRLFYNSRKLYVLKIMDQREYDKRAWIESCGCHEPQPDRPVSSQPSGRTTKRSGRKR